MSCLCFQTRKRDNPGDGADRVCDPGNTAIRAGENIFDPKPGVLDDEVI